MASPASAAGAYSSMASILGQAASNGAAGAGKAADGGFGALLEKSLSTVAENGRAADAQAMQAVAGKTDVVDVVTAVAESELALDTLVSVRDKVIAAYEEIMRMPI